MWKHNGYYLVHTKPDDLPYDLDGERAILQTVDPKRTGLDFDIEYLDKDFDALMNMIADVFGGRVRSITLSCRIARAAYTVDLRRFPNLCEFTMMRKSWNYDLATWMYRELARHPSIVDVYVGGFRSTGNSPDVCNLIAKPGMVRITTPLFNKYVMYALQLAATSRTLNRLDIETHHPIDNDAANKLLRISRTLSVVSVCNEGRSRFDGESALHEAYKIRQVLAFMTALIGHGKASRFLKCDGDNAIMTRVVQCLLGTTNEASQT